MPTPVSTAQFRNDETRLPLCETTEMSPGGGYRATICAHIEGGSRSAARPLGLQAVPRAARKRRTDRIPNRSEPWRTRSGCSKRACPTQAQARSRSRSNRTRTHSRTTTRFADTVICPSIPQPAIKHMRKRPRCSRPIQRRDSNHGLVIALGRAPHLRSWALVHESYGKSRRYPDRGLPHATRTDRARTPVNSGALPPATWPGTLKRSFFHRSAECRGWDGDPVRSNFPVDRDSKRVWPARREIGGCRA